MNTTTATLPQPGSLVDDVMVAAAFLAAHADDLIDPDLHDGRWIAPAQRRTAELIQARAQRLFAHAAHLARQEHTP
jgi:hypothetical protein